MSKKIALVAILATSTLVGLLPTTAGSQNLEGICPAWSNQPGDHITRASGARFLKAWKARHSGATYAGWSTEVGQYTTKARYSITYIDVNGKPRYVWWDIVNTCPLKRGGE